MDLAGSIIQAIREGDLLLRTGYLLTLLLTAILHRL
jgi:hypothetical protein